MNSSGGTISVKPKTNQNIQVYVRVRPLNNRERTIRSCEVVEVQSHKEVVVRHLLDSKMTKKFTFDRSFGPESRQSEVYQAVVAPLIEEVLSGYNCTVFAYGQTGTGKTHTMIGTECPELKSSWEDDSMVGIIPRALSHLFDELRMMEVEFSMRISYLELYNEELCDLLSTEDSTKIRIYDDSTKKGSVIVQGLEEIPVHSKHDVYKLLEKGKERRKTATTLMNAQSSRSHTVFSILVHIRENGMDGEEMLKLGKLHLVDLAGSENISKAGNEKGIRARETVNINQSLLTLGRVITALVERTPHIPYRESKLTRLLQESLGGRTKTSIIATISPGHKDLEETLSTLDYAHRAKNIQNKPEINQRLAKKTVLKEYTEEIDRLMRDLKAARDKNGIFLTEESYNNLVCKSDSQDKELNEKMLLIKALKDELASKEQLFNEVSLHLIEREEELKKTEKTLMDTKSKLGKTEKDLTKTKRRVEEKTQLVTKHVKTEIELTNQAKQLIEVADIASSDTFQLHNTIERRKMIDATNQSASEIFANKMDSIFETMNGQLNDLTHEHKTHSQIIVDEIGKNATAHKQFSTEATNKIEIISRLISESRNRFENCREKYSATFSDANSKHRTGFDQAMSELEKKDADIFGRMEKYFVEILQLFFAQNQIAAETCEQFNANIATINANVTEFTRCTQDRLAAFTEDAKKMVKTNIATIESTLEAKRNRLNRRAKELDSFYKTMQEMDEQENEEVNYLSGVVNVEKSLSEQITNNSDTKTKATEEFVESTSQICENMKTTTNDLNTARQYFLEAGKQSNVIMSDALKQYDCAKNETHDALRNLSKTHVETITETFTTYRKEIATCEDTLKENIDSECDQLNSLLGKETDRAKHYQTQYRAFNKSLQDTVTDYATKYTANIADCSTHVHTFKNNELKTYSSTGLTPARKEFTYPRVLSSTSPHASIIRRFRMDKEWSDSDTTMNSITEDSAIPSYELSNDELGINSTPIKTEASPIEERLKEIQRSNHKPVLQNFDEKLTISRKNSPAVMFDRENKENCLM